MEARTSESHPIVVDWLPIEQRVGLTQAPGRRGRSYHGPYLWQRDLGADLDRLVGHHGTGLLVSLIEDHELPQYGIEGLYEAAAARGLDVQRLPIRDMSVLPAHGPVIDLVDDIRQAASAGRVVVIHCIGGLGRTGTVAGCLLVELGHAPDAALRILSETRGPNCPEAPEQRDFIARYARARTGRVAGAVLGAAIGDAMGHPTEFLGMEEIHRRWGPDGVRGYELWWEDEASGRRFAPYTDDTQMAEVVLRSLCAGEATGDDLDATMRRMAEGFVLWLRNPQGGHRAPGKACQEGCRALEAGAPWSEAGAEGAGGCGSVMRSYPFGIRFSDDPATAEAWAAAHSALTHRAPIALAACGAMAVGVASLLGGSSVPRTLERMVEAAARQSEQTAAMMTRAIDEAQSGVGPEVTLDRLRAWAAHEAIAAAVYLLARHPDDPAAAILEGANTPGDSDSIATLAGALLGARQGLSGLPEEWVRDVERSGDLIGLAAAATDRRDHT